MLTSASSERLYTIWPSPVPSSCVVEDFDRHPADHCECLQQAVEVLMHDEVRKRCSASSLGRMRTARRSAQSRVVAEGDRTKSTCACWPDGVSKQTSNGFRQCLRTDRRHEPFHRSMDNIYILALRAARYARARINTSALVKHAHTCIALKPRRSINCLSRSAAGLGVVKSFGP